MEKENNLNSNKIFGLLIYMNDDDEKRTDYGEVIEKNVSYIEIRKRNGKPITVPWHRVLKFKETEGDQR